MANLQTIYEALQATRDQFEAVLSEKDVNFDREVGFAMQVFESNDYAAGIAENNQQSLRNSFVNVAAIGLSLNPATKYAYILPRKSGVELSVSYIGLVKLATDSGSVRWVKAERVFEEDSFAINGFGKLPTHTFNPFSKSRGEVVGVYCVAKTADGDYLTDAMSLAELNDIRERSDSWVKKKSGPWKTDEGEMQKKTILKRASKLWPRTERLDAAIHHLNEDAGEGLAVLARPEPAPTAGPSFDLKAALDAVLLCASRADLDSVFFAHGGFATKAKDAEGYRALKEACRNRAAALDAIPEREWGAPEALDQQTMDAAE